MEKKIILVLCMALYINANAQPSCLGINKSSASINSNFTAKPCGMAFSSTGKVAVTVFTGDGVLGEVKIWNIIKDFEANKAANYSIAAYAPEGVAFTPDGSTLLIVATTGESGLLVCKYDNATNKYIRQTKINGSYDRIDYSYTNARGVVALDNNTVLLTHEGNGGEVVKIDDIIKLENVKSTVVISGVPNVKAIAASSDKVIVALFDGKVNVYDRNNLSNVPVSIAVDGHPVDLAIGIVGCAKVFIDPVTRKRKTDYSGVRNIVYVTTFTNDNKSSSIKVISLKNNTLEASNTYIPTDGFSSITNGDIYSAPFGLVVKSPYLYVADGGKQRVVRFGSKLDFLEPRP